MDIAVWTIVGFIAGSIPFSLLLGRLAAKTDIRRYGDGNPGATNAWRAGGWRVGVPALCLDFLKGAVPVGLANFVVGLTGWGLAAVALAPIFGHAYSPFLRFRGGKALAVTFGVWTGLTLAQGPIMLGLFLGLFYAVQKNDGWAVVLGLLALVGYWQITSADITLVSIAVINLLLLAWKYRLNLQSKPQPRHWLLKLAGQPVD